MQGEDGGATIICGLSEVVKFELRGAIFYERAISCPGTRQGFTHYLTGFGPLLLLLGSMLLLLLRLLQMLGLMLVADVGAAAWAAVPSRVGGQPTARFAASLPTPPAGRSGA